MILHAYDGVPCAMMRGGTTRGFFFQPKDIPTDPHLRDRMFVDLIAGNELRQADGLGGGDMLLSKIVTVWNSHRQNVDIECNFGVVTPGSGRVKYGSNCGNLISAAALYAVEEGMRIGSNDTVRLYNPQSGSRVDARFMEAAEFKERLPQIKEMGMAMNGVPIELTFIDPAGTINRGLLPTGRAIDLLRLNDGTEIEASIVDSGTVYVFVAAETFGLECATDELSSSKQAEILEAVEALRGQAAVLCGLADSPENARVLTPAVPKVALISPPHGCDHGSGAAGSLPPGPDLLGRIISSQNFHKSYAVTGAIATISAAVIPDSIVNRVLRAAAIAAPLTLRIGHPTGVIESRLDWRQHGRQLQIQRAYMVRTARRLMTGTALVALSAAA